MPWIMPRRPERSPITSPIFSSGVSTSTDIIGSRRIGLARRIPSFGRATRAGTWDLLGAGRGLPRLRGQQLGLIGFGNIGRAVVPKARGFGLEVVAYTPRLDEGVDASGARTTRDLQALLAESDYVSLHLPATPETRGLIGEAELRAMKPTAYFITIMGHLADKLGDGFEFSIRPDQVDEFDEEIFAVEVAGKVEQENLEKRPVGIEGRSFAEISGTEP